MRKSFRLEWNGNDWSGTVGVGQLSNCMKNWVWKLKIGIQWV